MTPAARIQAVIDVLAEIIASTRPADAIASAYFRDRRYIGSKDRAAVNGRLYRIVREYHRLGWWILGAGAEVNARTLVIASLLFDKEHNAASLENSFSGETYAPDALTADEKKLATALQGKTLEDPAMPLREKTECPEWAFGSLQKTLGADFEKEMRAMQVAAPLDVRVNLIKAKRDDVLAALKKEGFDAQPGKISPLSIRLLGRPQITQHPLYLEGHIDIQDEGSQMVAVLADAKPGEQVCDFCAGAGGKTLALGASMDNRGRIVAMDVLGGRLNKAKERFRRAGLHNIETREIVEGDKFVKRHAGHFDLVLLDAPCTGTGTWRRDPDRHWRLLGPGLAELAALQSEILENAHRMVKPGGRLVYATCSLLREENEDQVEKFLAAHADFTAGKSIRLTPAKDDTDGFYAAVMVKKKLSS